MLLKNQDLEGGNAREKSQIAELFGVKDAAITAASRRFELLLEDDVQLRERVEKVRESLKFKKYRRDP